MLKPIDLNAIELSVLQCCFDVIEYETGDDFGSVARVIATMKPIEVNKIKGYLSQLVQKGYITISEQKNVSFTEKSNTLFGVSFNV